LAFLSFPLKFTLGMGQINNFILLFFSFFYYFMQKNKKILSSFFISLSYLLKLTPVFSVFYFLKNRKWQMVSIISLFVILGLASSYLLLPEQIVKDFFIHVLPNFRISINNSSYCVEYRGHKLLILNEDLSSEKKRKIKLKMKKPALERPALT